MMKICQRTFALSTLTLLCLFVSASAQEKPAGRAHFDVTNYRIEAQLIPDQHVLRAGAEVTFTPLDATRSVVFELNGALKVEKIERNGKALTNFVQDAAGTDTSLGPNVRIDLGEVVPAGQPVTLRFQWGGGLTSPEGGPLATKRLAYVGPEGSYLMYAARWFPFHEYAADLATSDITNIVPTGIQVAGTSDDPVTPQVSKDGNTRFRFTHHKPVLPGNFVAGQYITRSLKFGNYDIQFYAKVGSENRIENYAELMGTALQFYTREYGQPSFGTRMVVAQIDDESLDTYSGLGMVFLASKLFEPARPVPEEKLQREVAFQWWGQTVGLKSFDDAWISQEIGRASCRVSVE